MKEQFLSDLANFRIARRSATVLPGRNSIPPLKQITERGQTFEPAVSRKLGHAPLTESELGGSALKSVIRQKMVRRLAKETRKRAMKVIGGETSLPCNIIEFQAVIPGRKQEIAAAKQAPTEFQPGRGLCGRNFLCSAKHLLLCLHKLSPETEKGLVPSSRCKLTTGNQSLKWLETWKHRSSLRFDPVKKSSLSWIRSGVVE
ncbi:MAG TPA: hypothetical protein VE031_11120 [Chthoniobacterales bacterium]|nr:hypothetical protein [Chthoniobacterales bacterium]